MSEYGVDLAEWYAGGRWVALLDLIDMLPTACRLNEAMANDPELAREMVSVPAPADPWAPRVSEFDLQATISREILHAIMTLRQTMIALKGQKPGEVSPFPGPRTAIDAAVAARDRAETVRMVEMFGFGPDDI